MSYTPGPWRFEVGEPLWDGMPPTNYIRDAEGSALMADEMYYPWCPSNDADWKLIAAAPDLLAALIVAEYKLAELAESIGRMAGPVLWTDKIEQARAAIAKATT